MPTRRFSTMSIRPTPCTPAIVSRLSMSSVSGMATPLTDGRHALLPVNLDVRWRVGRLRRRFRQRIDVIRRLVPWIFQDAAFDRTAPEVLVRAVRARLRCRHRHVAHTRVFNLFGPRHAPDPRRGDDGHRRDRWREPTRRCAPGRCPSRCIRAQWPWRSPCARSRRASSR